jgi:hypothetical protein
MPLIELKEPKYVKNCGEGPLRYWDPVTKIYYHHRGNKNDKNPIFFKNPKEKSIKNTEWDCYDPNLFCSNCENYPGKHTENNPKKNQKKFSYSCKGHFIDNVLPFYYY